LAYEKLFEPIKIGTVQLKNRYVMAPMNLMNDWMGLVDEQEIAFNVARAMGGVSLIIYGAVLCTKLGIKVAPHPWIFMTDISHISGLSKLAESVHLCGTKIFIQVLPAAGGRTRPWSNEQPVGPSAVPFDMGGLATWERPEYKVYRKRLVNTSFYRTIVKPRVSRELTIEEIEKDIIGETAKNSKLVVLAGFDGIEVHACHYYYLLDQFRDPNLNKRTDKYGGDDDGRNRIIIETTDAVIRSVREETADFTVGVRLSAEQWGGYTFEETKVLAKQLEELGIDYLHITRGIPEGPKDKFDEIWKDGGFLQYSRELKKILKIPVITPNIHDPKLAEQAVTEGWTDVVALAKPLLADPEFVNKVKENRVNEITECKRDKYCQIGTWLGLPNKCMVNPEVGRERYNPKYQIHEGFKGTDMFPYILRKAK